MLPLMKPIKIPIKNMYSKQLLICDNLKKNKYKYNMIENFDINTIKDNESIFIIGRRETGKTHICKQILKTKKYMKNGVVFDPKDCDKNPDYKNYREIIKNEFIFDEYNPEILESLFTYKVKHKDNYSFVVLDNCFFNKEHFENKVFRKLVFNSRCYKIFPIITMAYCYKLPQSYISNIEKFFILQETNDNNLRRIYENIMSNYFEKYEDFVEKFRKYTSNGDCMVYDRLNNKLYRYIMSKNRKRKCREIS